MKNANSRWNKRVTIIMERNNLATAAIIVCMVCAVSTIPALMIAGSFQQPSVVNDYSTDKRTNTTTIININGTFENRTCHFVNVTRLIPYRTGGSSANATICNIPLVNRTLVTCAVAFSFNRRTGGGGQYMIDSLLNGKTLQINSYGFPYFSGYTTIDQAYYSIWNNPYQTTVLPNATGLILNIIGYSYDPNFPSGINVSVSLWWETW